MVSDISSTATLYGSQYPRASVAAKDNSLVISLGITNRSKCPPVSLSVHPRERRSVSAVAMSRSSKYYSSGRAAGTSMTLRTYIFYVSGHNFYGPESQLMWQELSYRKQIARQLRTQYVEGIYGPKYYTVTLKSRLRVTQGHWKRNHWTDHTRFTISRVIWH